MQGHCLCKAISVNVTGDLLFLYNCHCRQCRAFSGASYATNATVLADDLTISDPGNHLSCYQMQGGKRYFCGNCGSPVYSHPNEAETMPALHIGLLDDPPDKAIDANLWVSEKCPWVGIDGAVENFERALE